MAVIWPRKKTDLLDRRLLVRPALSKLLRDKGVPQAEKLNAQTAWANLDKFLLVPQVQSVFVDEDAEGYLGSVREAC